MSSSLAESPTPRHRDLWIARGLTLGPVALAFPVATAAVFGFGAERNTTADLLAVVYSVGLFAGFTTSLWPLASLREWTRFERIESLCLLFLVVSCLTHLSWELVWLLFHDAIHAARDAAWAYPWWAYIDGGDLRYAGSAPVLLCMAMAVVHLYSTALYFGSEILAGLPNVDTSSFLDSTIKFGLANAPWIVFPWFVLYWGQRKLRGRS